MKRVLTAAVFGGLLMLAVPQAVWADHNAEHQSGDCAAKTEKTAESDQQSPNQQRQGDTEQKHSDGGEILF